MSILLSAYFREGIIFSADKNVTTIDINGVQPNSVEPTATKVLATPNNRAVVGMVGLGELNGIPLDKWIDKYLTESSGLQDIDALAHDLRERIQMAFDNDFPQGTDISWAILVIHLGGFVARNGVEVPVMYHIWNHGGLNEKTGEYSPGQRTFEVSDQFEDRFKSLFHPDDYPTLVRQRLQEIVDKQGGFFWFNNGYKVPAFNVFKDFIWGALHIIRNAGFAAGLSGLDAHVAFCKMAVEVFGSYFTHHYPPPERAVGGGADAVVIPWPG